MTSGVLHRSGAAVGAYRQLLRAVDAASAACSIANPTGLRDVARRRFRAECAAFKRFAGDVEAEAAEMRRKIEQQASASQRRRKGGRNVPSTAKQQQKQLQALGQKVEAALDSELGRRAEDLEALLGSLDAAISAAAEAGGDEAALSAAPPSEMSSMLQALSAGIGNTFYQAQIERGIVEFARHRAARAERREADDEATSERQNRLMQHAVLPFLEKLALFHDGLDRTVVGANAASTARPGDADDANDETADSSPGRLSERELQELLASPRDGVTMHVLTHGRNEAVALEVDDALGRQVVFVRCEDFAWSESPLERVEVAEGRESVFPRGSVFHAEWHALATRLCDALRAETPLHRSRGTVLVGHGVGGAVALAMAAMLHSDGFQIRNVVSFGAPKVVVTLQNRVVEALNPIRVMLVGDPLIEMPVTAADGQPFRHFGEGLLVGDVEQQAAAAAAAARATTNDEGEGEKDATRDESADALHDMMTATETSTPPAPAPPPPRSFSEHRDAEDEPNDDDSDDADGFGPDLAPEQAARLEELSATRFGVAAYLAALQDAQAPLTYVDPEEDEVWDAGDKSAAYDRLLATIIADGQDSGNLFGKQRSPE